MSISAYDMVQDNITNDSNLVSVHNPLVFKINVTYSSTAPEILYCKIYDDSSTLLGTFKCIPWQDILATVRQFIFVADGILRGLMDDFDDFQQSSGSIQYCDGMTKFFNIQFADFVTPIDSAEVDIVAIHAVRQFGSDQNAEDIFLNEAKTYIGAENKPVYAYFYNDDEANTVSINPGGGNDRFVDYDGSPFVDTDSNNFVGIGT